MFDYDVAIVGGGPAGLNAALILGRCCRRVLVCDHGQPRNAAATAVNGFLGLDGIAPHELRSRGRVQAEMYGVRFLDQEVIFADRSTNLGNGGVGFQLTFHDDRPLTARKLLLATGLTDVLPEVPNLRSYYGHDVYHCPYCDGWEQRGRRLIALGARSGNVAQIAGYLGKNDTFDKAIARFARAYADQTEVDYERFRKAVRAGDIAAEAGV